MRIIELIIDELNGLSGFDALSVVEHPAIESNFVMLNKDKQKPFELKTVDDEQKILLGAALIPNKPIYRRDESGEEYYIYFSKETVKKMLHLLFKEGKQNKATLEHGKEVEGLTIVEAWIKEDMTHDKSALYGNEDPVGSAIVMQKVDNDEVWSLAKQGKIKGFSIEAYFADKFQASKEKPILEQIKDILNEDS